MTERNVHSDALDAVTGEIRGSGLDSAEVDRITSRSWRTIAGELDRTLGSCGDFQALIPALIAGELSPARALLVEDHTGGCVACRRALLEARGGVTATAAVIRTANAGPPRWMRLAAAAVVALGLGLVGFVTIGNVVADRSLTATVISLGDDLQLVGSSTTSTVADGSVISSRQLLRSPKDNGAEIVLADGSVVEMAPRSELDLVGDRAAAPRCGCEGATSSFAPPSSTGAACSWPRTTAGWRSRERCSPSTTASRAPAYR